MGPDVKILAITFFQSCLPIPIIKFSEDMHIFGK